MSNKILIFRRPVNGVLVEQRVADGFINGTAMCMSHGKKIDGWAKPRETWDFLLARSRKMGIEVKAEYVRNSTVTRLARVFPHLLTVKRGSPANGGGTWVHHKLAVSLAQFCSTEFAILVSDWVEEWLTTGKNPIYDVDPDVEWEVWQQRYDIRIRLKDYLRPELMTAVANWAIGNGENPRTLCSNVHDLMNERIQGSKAQQVRLMGGLPLSVLIRDYFDAVPLSEYSAINKLAKNNILDRGLSPLDAVNNACDSYLGKNYQPKPVRIVENLYSAGKRIRASKKRKRLQQGQQLDLFDNQAS